MHVRATLILLAAGLVCSMIALRASDDRILVATAMSQRIQNTRADADDLSRLVDDTMVRRFRSAGLLVPVAGSTASYYLHGVPARYRYLRPWTRTFLRRLSRQFHARFGTRLRVTALVRTASYQRVLDVRNANAASASGPLRSSHLTGATIDVSKRFMKRAHLTWMRRVLYQLRQEGVLYALEEFRQPCFHVMVYRSYEDYVQRATS
jgi:hypothetical protein